jgi:hypothetical protein
LREERLVLGQPGKAVYVTATPEDTSDQRGQDGGGEELRALASEMRAALRDLSGRVEALERAIGGTEA